MTFFAPIEVKVAVVTGLVSLIAGVPNAIAVFDDSSSTKNTPPRVKQAQQDSGRAKQDAGTAKQDAGTANEVGMASCVTVHRRVLDLLKAHPRLRARYALSGDGARQGLASLNSAQEIRRCGSSERLIEADVPAAGGSR